MPLPAATLHYPHDRVLLSRTRLAYVHLRNLLTDAKRDRAAKVYGYVTVWLPEELILLYMQEGEVVNATATPDGMHFRVAVDRRGDRDGAVGGGVRRDLFPRGRRRAARDHVLVTGAGAGRVALGAQRARPGRRVRVSPRDDARRRGGGARGGRRRELRHRPEWRGRSRILRHGRQRERGGSPHRAARRREDRRAQDDAPLAGAAAASGAGAARDDPGVSRPHGGDREAARRLRRRRRTPPWRSTRARC